MLRLSCLLDARVPFVGGRNFTTEKNHVAMSFEQVIALRPISGEPLHYETTARIKHVVPRNRLTSPTLFRHGCPKHVYEACSCDRAGFVTMYAEPCLCFADSTNRWSATLELEAASLKGVGGHAVLSVMLPPLGPVGDQLFGCTADQYSKLEPAACVQCFRRLRDKEIKFCGSANKPKRSSPDDAAPATTGFVKDEIPHHTMARLLTNLVPVV
jgi:hypothetical protein